MDWIYFIDLFGTGVFAISGVLAAIQKKFDLVGSLIIGFVTAIGGGTLRDMLIGRFPVGWLNDRNYFLVIIIGYLIAYLFKEKVIRFRRSMFLFDTVGIWPIYHIGDTDCLRAGPSYRALSDYGSHLRLFWRGDSGYLGE